MDAVRTAIMSNRFNAIVEEASAAVYPVSYTHLTLPTSDLV